MTAEEPTFGLKCVRLAYWAFIVSIPVETIIYFTQLRDDGKSGVTISRILGILVFTLAVANWRACFKRVPAAFWAIVWYIAAYALSQLWLPTELDARFQMHQATMLQMAALFIVSVNLLSDADFRHKILRAYGWSVSLVAAALVLGVFGEPVFEEGRRSITTQDPNLTAALFAVGAVAIAGDPKLFERRFILLRLPLSLAAVGVLSAAILQTGSRGGLLAYVAGILALLLTGARSTILARALIGALTACLLGALVVHEFQAGSSTAARLERAWNDGDTTGRTRIYDVAWSMFLDKPLFGYGGVNNRFLLGVQLNHDFRDTHNLFLGMLTEVGLLGSAPLFAALLCALWSAWRAGSALAVAPLCTLVAINLSVTGSGEKIFWIAWAAAAAASYGRARARA